MSGKKEKEARKSKTERKITYMDVWRTQGALPHLMNIKRMGKTGQEPLQANVSIKIARLARQLREEMALIVPIHTGLIEKFGEEDAVTKKKSVSQGNLNYDVFFQEFTEVLKQEIPWDLDPVELPGDSLIDPAVLIDLEPFVEVK